MQAQTPLPLAQQMTQNDSMKYLMDPALDIFQTLIMNLDSEGRYLFLNAIANQLRYPNSHTYFFSFVLLYLFLGANQVNLSLSLSLSRSLMLSFQVSSEHKL